MSLFIKNILNAEIKLNFSFWRCFFNAMAQGWSQLKFYSIEWAPNLKALTIRSIPIAIIWLATTRY